LDQTSDDEDLRLKVGRTMVKMLFLGHMSSWKGKKKAAVQMKRTQQQSSETKLDDNSFAVALVLKTHRGSFVGTAI